MSDPRAAVLPHSPQDNIVRADRAERERVRVVLDECDVTVSRDYLMIRRRALIQELNAINESLGIRRAPKDHR